MKMILTILGALILGAGAAAGVFFYFGGKLPEAEKITRLPPPSEEVVEHWPVDLGSIPIPTYRGGRISGFTFIKITFTLRGDYDAKFLNMHLPVFRDKIIRAYFKQSVPMTRDGLQVDYGKIEKRVQKMVDDYFLPGLVLDTKAEFAPG